MIPTSALCASQTVELEKGGGVKETTHIQEQIKLYKVPYNLAYNLAGKSCFNYKNTHYNAACDKIVAERCKTWEC